MQVLVQYPGGELGAGLLGSRGDVGYSWKPVRARKASIKLPTSLHES